MTVSQVYGWVSWSHADDSVEYGLFLLHFVSCNISGLLANNRRRSVLDIAQHLLKHANYITEILYTKHQKREAQIHAYSTCSLSNRHQKQFNSQKSPTYNFWKIYVRLNMLK